MDVNHCTFKDIRGSCRKNSIMHVDKHVTIFLVLTSQQMLVMLLVMSATLVQTQGNKMMTAASH